MNDAQVLEITAGALEICAKLALPALLLTLAIGVVVSIVQTITQIQEQSLTFVPKLLGVGAIVLLGGNWMVKELVEWVTQLWQSIPSML